MAFGAETETHYARRTGLRPVKKFVGSNPFREASNEELIRLLECNEHCYDGVSRNVKTRRDGLYFRDILTKEENPESGGSSKWVDYEPFNDEGYCELFGEAPLQLALYLECRRRVSEILSKG